MKLLVIRCIEFELKWLFAFVLYRRTVVSIPCGPSALAVKEAAWGLARYAAISQVLFHYESMFVEISSFLE